MQLLGETRDAMAQGFMELLQKELDKHSREDQYWLLVHTKPLKGQTVIGSFQTFKQVFAKMNAEPPAMLGTIRIHVDNKKGRYKMEVFPHDAPIDQSVYDQDAEFVPDVYESSFKVGSALLYQ